MVDWWKVVGVISLVGGVVSIILIEPTPSLLKYLGIGLWMGIGIGILLREIKFTPRYYRGVRIYGNLIWPFIARKPIDISGPDVKVFQPRCPNCTGEVEDRYEEQNQNALFFACRNRKDDEKCVITSIEPHVYKDTHSLFEHIKRMIKYEIENEDITLNKTEEKWQHTDERAMELGKILAQFFGIKPGKIEISTPTENVFKNIKFEDRRRSKDYETPWSKK